MVNYILLLISIFGVSLYDIYLSLKYSETLKSMELNPICSWIIALDNTLALFIVMKVAGTFAAMAIMSALLYKCPRIGKPVVFVIFTLQMLLLYVLCCA